MQYAPPTKKGNIYVGFFPHNGDFKDKLYVFGEGVFIRLMDRYFHKYIYDVNTQFRTDFTNYYDAGDSKKYRFKEHFKAEYHIYYEEAAYSRYNIEYLEILLTESGAQIVNADYRHATVNIIPETMNETVQYVNADGQVEGEFVFEAMRYLLDVTPLHSNITRSYLEIYENPYHLEPVVFSMLDRYRPTWVKDNVISAVVNANFDDITNGVFAPNTYITVLYPPNVELSRYKIKLEVCEDGGTEFLRESYYPYNLTDIPLKILEIPFSSGMDGNYELLYSYNLSSKATSNVNPNNGAFYYQPVITLQYDRFTSEISIWNGSSGADIVLPNGIEEQLF
jgi:hypothetical protein